MSAFNTSLLREKFVINDAMPEASDEMPVVALSNRLGVPLVSDNGHLHESFVVRAQNMHTCARFGAQIAREFQETGPILAPQRSKPFDWQGAYDSIIKGYEKNWNPQRWVAVYHKGRVIFEDGEAERHPFLDIIEQCDARSKGDYDKAVRVAEDAFKQAGKMVMIEHDSNVALIMSVTKEIGKCGVILRGPDKTTTFNFNAKKRADRVVRPSQCLSAAAAFLEGIQLAFMIGMTQQKLYYELIGSDSSDAKKMDEASAKLGRLNVAITQFEHLLDVSYRPDRPNFSNMISDAEEFARKIFAAEIKRKIDTGEEDSGQWVV